MDSLSQAVSTIPPAGHGRYFLKASFLSENQVMNALLPIDIIKVLNRDHLRFILVGAYGLAGWIKKPRATEDVDFIVMARHHKKATKALLSAFPQLEADDQEVGTRFRYRETQEIIVDLIKENQPLIRAAFKHTETVTASGETYLIPTLEFALALKFAPMISLKRADLDKHQDAHDFIAMVRANPDIDLDTLAELGKLVYPGGGKEIVQKVEDVRAGRKLQL